MVKQEDPKIIFFDLETLPNLDTVMKIIPSIGNWPGRTLKAELNSIICFGYKVLGDKKAKCINAWDFENWNEDVNDDSAVVMMAYEILKDADVIVTHNGKRFDLPVLNTRLMANGFPPLHKIVHVDTKNVAKRLSLYSNALNNVAKFFKLEEKMENGGWDLWCKVQKRDKKAQKTMSEYCAQDVEVLEQVYKKLRPLLKNAETANYAHRKAERSCNSCGSSNIVGHGTYMRKTGERQRYICNDCGSTMSEKIGNKNSLTTESI